MKLLKQVVVLWALALSVLLMAQTASMAQDGPSAEAVAAAEAARAFAAADADFAVLCAADAVYPELVPEVAGALASAGASAVALAGHGGDREDEYRAAGVDTFLHLGADAVAVLTGLLNVLAEGGSA